MIRPQKMKQIELTVLAKDIDAVIEFLGRGAFMQFSQKDQRVVGSAGPPQPEDAPQPENIPKQIVQNLEKIRAAAAYLKVDLPKEPEETSMLPKPADDEGAAAVCAGIEALHKQEQSEEQERKKLEHALEEAKSFANLNAPFKELDHLSYLTLRIGRVEPKGQTEMHEHLSDRAVIIPLGEDRVLAAASRKGRFALDSELKKYSFTPITIPEGFRGVPKEMLESLEKRLAEVRENLGRIEAEKTGLRERYGPELRGLAGSYIMASITEELKNNLIATQNVFLLSGWIPAVTIPTVAEPLSRITENRIGIRTFIPEELKKIKQGVEKVPVSLDNRGFVKGFERLVFSYGAPLYGTIDPTPFVAFFFILFFGVMFGDVGQGLILLLLGILSSSRGHPKLSGLRVYSKPLVAVGITSMIMGLLTGEVFAVEGLLAGPTKAVCGLFMTLTGQTGEPPEQILHLMPDGHNINKLFYFFGFTIALGVLFNSVGLWINVINQFTLKNYEKAFFSKTGLAGIGIFWYALFIGIRCLKGGRFESFDLGVLAIPAGCIFFGPVLWRAIAGERPLCEHGLMTFIIEGFVEILETLSSYISNTVSFLRVGAFALSHAVLSFIIFTFSEMLTSLPGGHLFSVILMVFGNLVIIVLEGMIVAIQVVRLQYYEFFSKFFTKTGVEFTPFRFHKKTVSGETAD
jgi:V/A-type H+-transporting ATPase subunit I